MRFLTVHKDAADGEDDDDFDLDALAGIGAIEASLSDIASESGRSFIAQLNLPGQSSMFDQVNDRAVAYAKARAAELVSGVDDATRDDLRSIIATGLADNIGMDAIADNIRDAYAFSEKRADLIARTEITMANQTGALDGMKLARGAGVKLKKVWLPDEDPCEECQENADDGPIDLDDTFSGTGDDAPPGHPRCLPGHSLISPGVNVTGATKRWYDGNLTIIRTSSGHELACTPNHPVLTDRGWVAAGLLNEGSNVISAGLGQRMSILPDDDNQNMPSSIHDIAEAFGRSLHVTAKPVKVSAPDFHGDGKGSEVAIIWADSKLRDSFDTASAEHSGEVSFVDTAVASLSHNTGGFLQKELISLGDASNGIVSSTDLSGSFANISGAPDQFLSGRPATAFDARVSENSPDYATANTILASKGLFRDAVPIEITDFVNGDYSSWFADTVISRHELPFSGYVYNLETTTGYYIAQGVIVHNCECSLISEVEDADRNEDEEDE